MFKWINGFYVKTTKTILGKLIWLIPILLMIDFLSELLISNFQQLFVSELHILRKCEAELVYKDEKSVFRIEHREIDEGDVRAPIKCIVLLNDSKHSGISGWANSSDFSWKTPCLVDLRKTYIEKIAQLTLVKKRRVLVSFIDEDDAGISFSKYLECKTSP